MTITLGGRTQRVKQTANQDAYPAWFMPAVSGSSEHTRSAVDAGLVYRQNDWRVYGKFGTTFRFANTDELFGYDALTGNPVFAGNLQPQHGTIGELGGSATFGPLSLQLAAYQMDLKDEIGYDGAQGANINFDPTRRRGLETEVAWRITSTLKTQLAYTYTDAKFREGVYQDKSVPMVPNNKASSASTGRAVKLATMACRPTISAIAGSVAIMRTSSKCSPVTRRLISSPIGALDR
jgi:iron complex outermembrane receptor protein